MQNNKFWYLFFKLLSFCESLFKSAFYQIIHTSFRYYSSLLKSSKFVFFANFVKKEQNKIPNILWISPCNVSRFWWIKWIKGLQVRFFTFSSHNTVDKLFHFPVSLGMSKMTFRNVFVHYYNSLCKNTNILFSDNLTNWFIIKSILSGNGFRIFAEHFTLKEIVFFYKAKKNAGASRDDQRLISSFTRIFFL